jgi:hypothetical protein
MRDEMNEACVPSTGMGIGFDESEPSIPNEVKLVIKPAANGRLITMQHYAPNSAHAHKPDWRTTLYLVPEGHSLIESITALLVSANLGK